MGMDTAIREAVRQVMKEAIGELKEALAAMPGRRATDEFWPVRKAAKVAGVSDWTVREWIKEGRLKSYGAGRVLRLRRSEFEAFLSKRAAEPANVDPEDLARQILERQKSKGRR